MERKFSQFLFDRDDYTLLGIVNDVLKRRSPSQSLSALMAPYMHPHGIKEMAAPAGLRIAHAIAGLLGSLETGMAHDRIAALRCLMDEVFNSSATSFYKNNTARVLIQIMKELVRNEGNELRQLQLAHDFRMATGGRPLLIRRELARYYLLEMPEQWNQFAFDDHVHDANTKGRKSSTHLLLDAWIKGIRSLTVVYYNHVELEVVEELLEASAILGIHVRIGIEFSSAFRGKFVRFIWELEGFLDNHSLLHFFQEEAVQEMLAAGRQVSLYQQRYVFDALEAFNTRHKPTLEAELGLKVSSLDREDFLRFVGTGQPSLFHLAKYIQMICRSLLEAEARIICADCPSGDPERRKRLAVCTAKMRGLGIEGILERFLQPCRNPELHDPDVPQALMPPLMQLGPPDLLGRLASLHSNSCFTLNLNKLSIQDTLELLYICKGRITHLESFNLKNAQYGNPAAAGEMGGFGAKRGYLLLNALQEALNSNNVIALKRVVRAIIRDFEQSQPFGGGKAGGSVALQAKDAEAEVGVWEGPERMARRRRVLLAILQDIGGLHTLYGRGHSLGSRIGSGSTGQSQARYGMGLAVLPTLPGRAQRMAKVLHQDGSRKLIPVTARMIRHHHIREEKAGRYAWLRRLLPHSAPGERGSTAEWSDWTVDRFAIHPGRDGNIVALGGIHQPPLLEIPGTEERLKRPFGYLNSNLYNTLKILLGFIPAFLTFMLTKDWWLLAYGGAFIWFGITGIRNIIQSVLGGGGVSRSPLLPWGTLVNWNRIADSLFFTGLSVPLLDYFIKTLLLERHMGITIASNPVMLYTVMSLANGIYIASHNTLRGLPKSTAVGNLFRSAFAIPLSILFNAAIGAILEYGMVADVDDVLQKWAAIIAKLASDCVAAVIEGLADRQNNIRIRLLDYQEKLAGLFAAFSRLDVLFPEEDVLDLLQNPPALMTAVPGDGQELSKIFIVNALDFMYIWMYQPRAGKALQQTVAAMSAEEWLIFYRSQEMLRQTREISQLFVDGLLGKNFAKALAFYLGQSESYLLDMERLGETRKAFEAKREMRRAH